MEKLEREIKDFYETAKQSLHFERKLDNLLTQTFKKLLEERGDEKVWAVCGTYNSHKMRELLISESVCICPCCVQVVQSIWDCSEEAFEVVAREKEHAVVVEYTTLKDAYEMAYEGGGFMLSDYIKRRCGIL